MDTTQHTYQYGSDPRHVVTLSEVEAHAINNLRFYNVDPKTGYGYINDHEIDLEAYGRAASQLNEYIDAHGGSIPCTQEYLDHHQILTLIK